MNHSHGHVQVADVDERLGDARLLAAVVVNGLLTIVQVVGGVLCELPPAGCSVAVVGGDWGV